MGLPAHPVDTIFLCVSTVTYSVLLNGVKCGDIRPATRLRQGDPLSPYHFICCVEVFLRMVESATLQGKIKGLK